MKISAYWGLTAPMALIALDEQTILRYLKVLQYGNKSFINNFKIELTVLAKALDNVVIVNNESTIFDEFSESGSLENGSILGCSIDNNLAVNLVKRDFAKLVALKILENERKGKYFSFSGNAVDFLYSKVEEFLNTASFQFEKMKSLILKFTRSLLSDTGVSVSTEFVQEFGFITEPPSSVYYEGKCYGVSPEVKKVFQNFFEKKKMILNILSSISSDVIDDNLVFGCPFFSIIRRKPRSIYYSVINEFEYVKSKQNVVFLNSTISTCRESVNVFKECLKQYVSTSAHIDNSKMMDSSKFNNVSLEFDTKKLRFFQQLIKEGKFNVDSLTEDDFNLISQLYDRIAVLDEDYLNNYFGINVNWEKFQYELFPIGIFGMNLHSIDLFGEALSNSVLATGNVIVKTEEEIDEINLIVNDVEALIDSLKPLGGDLVE